MLDAPFEPLTYVWRVLFVLALLFGLAFWLRRLRGARAGFGPGQTRMRIVESLSVGHQRYLHIVAIGEQRFLIAVSPQSIAFLTELDGGADAYPEDGEGGLNDRDDIQFETFMKTAEGGTPKEEAER